MKYQFYEIIHSYEDRATKAARLAEKIREQKNYSWVGIYNVLENDISLINWSGQGEPSYSLFPRDKGLNGRAVAARQIVCVNDTTLDPDYLPTFGNTQSEIIAPVISPFTGEIIGTIDVESRQKNAFTQEDVEYLRQCALAITELWKK